MNINMFNGYDLRHELLLTTRQKTKLRNAFKNNMPTDIKLSGALISKLIQHCKFLGALLSKLAGPLMKVAVPSAKNVLAPLGTAAASAIDAGIQIKLWSSFRLCFSISNFNNFKWRNEWHFEKIVQALEHSNILLKGVTKTIKNETKEQKEGFLGMLLETLGASLLGNMLTGKGIVRADYRNRKRLGRAGYGNKIF